MKLSVILPTYNESGNIVQLIEAILRAVPDKWDREIVVVDDDSQDGTYELVTRTFKDQPAVIAKKRTADRGLANSIRAGLEMATGDQLLVMDTDFTHDPVEIPKMLHLAEYFDIVSGSRFCAGGSMSSTRHYLASMSYNLILRLILRTQIQDNLGGYFTIKRQDLDNLPFDAIFHGYGDYFFRLLHCAEKKGLSIIEIPAHYHSRKAGKSKSSFFRLLFSYSLAVIRFKLSFPGIDAAKKNDRR